MLAYASITVKLFSSCCGVLIYKKFSCKCGVDALDRYLQTNASQDHKRHVAAVFFLTEEGDDNIIGYYTLAVTSIALGGQQAA
jgi:hypothetical protein